MEAVNDRATDVRLMQECLQLARRAEGRTSPNPMVGAIITDVDGNVVGRGFHPAAGQPHAEVFAFDQAGEAARGGTLYVSLEPCCHHGRTPPCLCRVLTSGVARVVAGMVDPNPLVAGQSLRELEIAGVRTETGICEEECRWLNRGFIKRMTTGLPWIALKMATTMDGRIADRSGSSRWVSGPVARAYVHQLRNQLDGVMVGAGTAINDDPELTVRDLENSRDPVRIIFDPDLQLKLSARVFREASAGSTVSKTLVLTKQSNAVEKAGTYPAHVQLIGFEGDARTVSLKSLVQSLPEEINTILCEGGGKFAASLLTEQLIDEVHWIVAPKLLGDGDAVPALCGMWHVGLDNCSQVENKSVSLLGDDVLITGTVKYKDT